MVSGVEVSRIVLLAFVLIGYLPVVIAYRRYAITWMFSAYTVLVAGAVAIILGDVFGAVIWLVPPITLTGAGVLFFLSAWKSHAEINKLERRIEENKISL